MIVKDMANKLKQDIPTVYLALKKNETPVIAKIFAMITVVYALSPVDLVPDFIPIIGFLDDLIILPMLVSITIKFIPKEILNQCRVKSKNLWNNGKPKKWYFSIPIIAIWVLLLVKVVTYNIYIV